MEAWGPVGKGAERRGGDRMEGRPGAQWVKALNGGSGTGWNGGLGPSG